MARRINDFKTRLAGGVRPNLYQVRINFPQSIVGTGTALSEKTEFLCRTAQLPAHTQGLIEVPFRGRFLKIPGDRTYEAWTATFYNTADFDLRSAFEKWVNAGNKVDENIGTLNFGSEGSLVGNYFTDIIIEQKSKEAGAGTADDPNLTLRAYKLVGAWPTNVGAINLAYDSNDAIEEFDVEFQYQYFDAGASASSIEELSTQNVSNV